MSVAEAGLSRYGLLRLKNAELAVDGTGMLRFSLNDVRENLLGVGIDDGPWLEIQARVQFLQGACTAFRMFNNPDPKTALGMDCPGRLPQFWVLVRCVAFWVRYVSVREMLPINDGLACQRRATPPATSGAAMEVPDQYD